MVAFFDRDGTINVDTGYLYEPDKLEFIPITLSLIKCFNDYHVPVIVITNQSGIARGYYTIDEMHTLHNYMNYRLKTEYDCHIDAFYYCPHYPEISGTCNCRKPKPGMFLEAIKDYNANISQSFSFGDKQRDEQATIAAGIQRFYYIQNVNNLFVEKIAKELESLKKGEQP